MIEDARNMEQRVRMQFASEEAERMVERHQSASHPEVQCQCLECLYAREVLAQARAWRECV